MMKHFCEILALTLILIPIHGSAQDTSDATMENERAVYTRGVVDSTGVSLPLGYFIVLRNEGKLCALRFTSFRRERDENLITSKMPYDRKKDSIYAEYEWYFSKSRTGSFTGAGVTTGKGEVYSKPYLGLGIWPGNRYFSCGSFGSLIDWRYPTGISLIERKKHMEDPTVSIGEAALTSWQNIAEVDALEETLVWYQNKEEKVTFPIEPDYESKYIVIPLEDIPPR